MLPFLHRILLLSALFLFSACISSVFAQTFGERYTNSTEVPLTYFLPGDVSYDSSIPEPGEILGFNIGEWHLRHDLMVRYLEALAAASDRVEIHHYGRSHELRPLVLLTITSPENLQNIDSIRENHVKLTNPAVSRDLNIENMPAVVWLGYSVHGNEHSGANAAVLAAYYYAAAQGSEVNRILDGTVILVDPSFNPDGQDRFVSWVNSHRNMNRLTTNPVDREFNEPWPRSRTNHYWFDLNRDWMPLQHPESRYRLEQFHKWKPNVLTDHHEMGTNATYFFQPGIPSRNNPLTPERNYELTAKLAEYHAQYLDRFGQLYYTKESFDDFYVGKGSTYPDLNGTIGILFEQASSRGHAQESVHGLVPFPETIRNQFQTSLSTVTGTHALRIEFLSFLREHYLTAMQEAGRDNTAAYVISAPEDPAKMAHLLDILKRHQIQVYSLGRSIEANDHSFTAGRDYIIPSVQPQYRLVRSLFETRTTFTDSLFYDVSTWSLPHAFNLNHAELNRRSFNANLLGDLPGPESVSLPEGRLHGGQARHAYLFEWDGYYTPRALYALQREGIRTKVANRDFRVETQTGARDFRAGTIMVPVAIQDKCSPEELYAKVREVAIKNALEIYAADTGLSRSGIDLGSPSFSVLTMPEVLLLVGDGVNVSEAGETWFQMDMRYHMPVTMVETNRFNNTDLSRYTHIVFPSGNYGQINSRGRDNLQRWLNDGGVIVGYKNAIQWLVQNDFATAAFVRDDDEKSKDPLPYADVAQNRGAQVIGGSIFNTSTDLSHPLLYGYRNEELSVFRNSTIFIEAPQNRYAAPLRYTSSPLISGYISSQNLEIMPGTASLMVSGRGSGRTILFADNPNFRAFWFGTNKLFANSLFFGSTINWATIER
ncbi:MAG: zinc carboxypeptidase [Balneolales bacterium]|nr:zinc carboxypeptidase [Balneolales bacterium]